MTYPTNDFYHQYIADIVLEALAKMPNCNRAQLWRKLEHIPNDIISDYLQRLVDKGIVVKTTIETGMKSITNYNIKEQ